VCDSSLDHNRSWRDPGYAQANSHPVVCVSLDDAEAYANWLVKKTGKPYRLPSEAEWEYAARGQTLPGTYPRYWFGDDGKALCRYGNGPDLTARHVFDPRDILDPLNKLGFWASCNDGYAYTSPVGHYLANAFGLHDMLGNVEQWIVDCWHYNYDGAPTDGSAWTDGCSNPGYSLVRGGSWGSVLFEFRVATRERRRGASDGRGFRLARTLVP
jgi:formylglycine-generating enzyme required for sulfatase activity